MIHAERVRSIARALLDKTRRGQVNWVAGLNSHTANCSLTLEKSAVILTYEDHPVEAPQIHLSLYRVERGEVGLTPVATLTAYDDGAELNPREADPQEEADSSLLSELYREATKYAYKWDEVMADLETALSGTGKVGRADVAPERPGQFSTLF